MSGTFDATDQRPHYVYAIFGDGDQVLYVGCARYVHDRIRFHMEPSTQSVASRVLQRLGRYWDATQYPTKAEARAAERRLIAAATPLLNKQHNPRYRKNVRELPIVPRARAA